MTTLDLADIQGNLLRGYRSAHARHFALGVGDAGGARTFLAGLVSGDEASSPQVTTAQQWDSTPPYCLNVGLTWEVWAPWASRPTSWRTSRPRSGRPPSGPRIPIPISPVRADWVTSGTAHRITGFWAERVPRPCTLCFRSTPTLLVRAGSIPGSRLGCAPGSRLDGLSEISAHDAKALADGAVHFGYRDGIAQPHIRGGPVGRFATCSRNLTRVTSLCSGRDYTNIYGGNFLYDLPHALGDNACYAAFRILRQDVQGFERLLDQWSQVWNLDRELIAAKLVGRWRTGVPLTLAPDTAHTDPRIPTAERQQLRLRAGSGAPDLLRRRGRDAPPGRRAHPARLNPRFAVMGQPHSRRLVRRSMPYGPPATRSRPARRRDRAWSDWAVPVRRSGAAVRVPPARMDQRKVSATHGLRGTRDPILGAQPASGGKFVLAHGRQPRPDRDDWSAPARPDAGQRLLPGAGDLGLAFSRCTAQRARGRIAP